VTTKLSTIADIDIDEGIKDVLEAMGIQKLYPPQSDAIPYALAHKNLVLAIPTASGKSLVAYLAILKSVLNGGKAIYIVPLRALAGEKYEDFMEFQKLGIKVSMSIGDLDTPDPELEHYDIIVATSEKADSLLRHRADWLQRLTVVVADEVHLINDPERGPTLEVILARLKQINPEAQIIALSATIQNSAEIAKWLNGVHITSNWRPVPLKEGVYYQNTVEFTDKSCIYCERITGKPIADLIRDTISAGAQVLIFVNTRRSTERLAEELTGTVSEYLTPMERERLQHISHILIGRQVEPTAVGMRLGQCVTYGTAFHNAGLTNFQRKIIETGFKSGVIKCIVATPTLAAGINLPARRVIIRDLTRYDANLGITYIPVLEIKQMCGRAGRPKYDAVGEAIAIAKSGAEKDDIMENYFLGEPEPVESKLGLEPALRVHILSSIATGFVTSRKSLKSFIESTFYACQASYKKIEPRINAVIKFLVRERFIDTRKGVYKATEFGRRTSELYIDPASAVILRDALLQSTRINATEFSYLHTICATPDMIKIYLRRFDYNWVTMLAYENYDTLLIKPNASIGFIESDWFLSEIKTAALLQSWIEERAEGEITRKFGVGPGDIRTKVETGEWLLYSMCELAKLFNKASIRHLEPLVRRIKYGIKSELLELVKLKGVGRTRARALYTHGYHTLKDLMCADIKTLLRVEGIGKTLAENIKRQLRKEGTATYDRSVPIGVFTGADEEEAVALAELRAWGDRGRLDIAGVEPTGGKQLKLLG
jgi:helicase